MSISRLLRTSVAAFGAAGLLAACAATPQHADRPPSPGLVVGQGSLRAPAADAATADVVAASWRLGLAALSTGQGDATVVSPSSLAVALSMLAEGASGPGRAALEDALGASGDARRDAVALLRASLRPYDRDASGVQDDTLGPTPLVHQASQIVVDDGSALLDGFLDRLATGYGAGVLVTDLSSEGGLAPLHTWAEEHTGGLVKRSAITPSPDLVAAVQDAIALAAAWQVPFEPDGTHDRPFTRADGSSVEVPTMSILTDLAHVSVDGWQAVRLPYASDEGPGVHSDIVLPPAGVVARTVPVHVLAAIVAALDDAPLSKVELMLPRVDLSSKVDLLPALGAAGLGHLASAETSGLDGIVEGETLEVGQAVQQAVLIVAEDGTRAAALTEIGLRVTSVPLTDVTMIVDRPFLLTVADSSTGWPLFLAHVGDPSAAQAAG